MTIALHALVLPVYDQMLGAMSGVIEKAGAFCAEAGITEAEFLDARLAPNMLAFSWQVRLAASHAIDGLNGALEGRYVPDTSKPPETFVGLAERIVQTREALATLDPGSVDDLVGRDVLHVPRRVVFAAEDFICGFSMPNFFFHAVTAYDIARSKGVKVGKADFLGLLRARPLQSE